MKMSKIQIKDLNNSAKLIALSTEELQTKGGLVPLAVILGAYAVNYAVIAYEISQR
jgi:hypothetical protein